MSQKTLQHLRNASLTSLLENESAAWKAKAKHAYAAASALVKDLRPDDVVPLLTAELEVSTEFRNYSVSKKLKQKYWSEWFAELIIDRFWSELDEGRMPEPTPDEVSEVQKALDLYERVLTLDRTWTGLVTGQPTQRIDRNRLSTVANELHSSIEEAAARAHRVEVIAERYSGDLAEIPVWC